MKGRSGYFRDAVYHESIENACENEAIEKETVMRIVDEDVIGGVVEPEGKRREKKDDREEE
jgi:hypothetical protein